MPLRINTGNSSLDPKMWLDINGQAYVSVDCADSQIDICVSSTDVGSNYKVRLALEIWHTFENHVKHVIKKTHLPNTVIICKSFDPGMHRSNIIYNDFMFNRTKAYYSQFPFSTNTNKWYSHGQYSYIAPPLESAEKKQKIFVAPNKTHNGNHLTRKQERPYRQKIVSQLMSKEHLGHVGNVDNLGKFLYPHVQMPLCKDINELETTTAPLQYKRLGYNPPHNEYYKNTFISIYGESIEYGTSICPTEKTYDPLIKGHFILPFSCAGFVDFLKLKGFVFPNFINYEYDSEIDHDIRYKKYLEEMNRLLNMDMDTWRNHWNNNLDLIRHNQLIFHETPYDRVDLHKLLDNSGRF